MRIIAIIVLLVCNLFSYSQRDIQGMGQWKHHVPYHLGNSIADAGDKIYCGTQLGVFSYHKETGELTTYTKVEGLSDVEISTINYYEPLDILLIAYKNTNIDIIQNNNIINLGEIERKQIVGVKTINHIYFHNDFAYISCSFGIVVYDLNKLEVKDTYTSLGTLGEPQNVFSSTIAKDSLFLATDVGIISGSISLTENLLDFNNWHHINNNVYQSIISLNNDVILLKNDSSFLEKRVDNGWENLTEFGDDILYIFEGKDEMLIIKNDFLITTDLSLENTFSIKDIKTPVQVIHDGDIYWFCDSQNGIIKYENENIERLVPTGPSFGLIFRINYSNNKIFVNRGGYSSTYARQYGVMIVDVLFNSGWNAIGYWEDTLLQGITDISATVETSDGITYMASHGYGLIKKDNENTFEVFNSTNSPIRNSLNGEESFDRVTDLALDDNDNIWITNHGVIAGDTSIFKINEEGLWEGFVFPQISQSNFPTQIVIDNDDNKWVSLSSASTGNGVMVFNEELETSRLLIPGFENGDLQDTKINDMAVDKDGAVWLVGRSGVSYFPNPSQIFEGGESNDATKPIFEGRPLLEEEIVTAIAIDGGNRKWFGSDNGIWLMDPTGTEVIKNFNTSNSPLPINKINDIEINQETGEVFFATDLGVVSYRSDATEGSSDCIGKAKVFPNPVEPNYAGEVGITGLTNNAEIKITDVWGNLIYETQANGGAASWDLHDYNNQKAASGVYLILVNGIGRKKSCATRLAIIN